MIRSFLTRAYHDERAFVDVIKSGKIVDLTLTGILKLKLLSLISGEIERFQEFIKHYDVNRTGEHGKTAVHYVAEFGNA